MSPYFSLAFDFMLAIFTGVMVTLLGYFSFRRSLLHDEAVVRDETLATRLAEVTADNAALNIRIKKLEDDRLDLIRRVSLCDSARTMLVEAAIEMDKQLRSAGQVPKFNIDALMSGMNEALL